MEDYRHSVTSGDHVLCFLYRPAYKISVQLLLSYPNCVVAATYGNLPGHVLCMILHRSRDLTGVVLMIFMTVITIFMINIMIFIVREYL